MKWNSKKAFTLVEMLAVLVIMGLMIGMGIVAFTRVAQGAKLQTAGREFFNTARLARQYAITHSCYTRLAMSYEGTTNIDLVPNCRSYAVLTGNIASNGAIPWVYLTGWRKLPDGVVFDFSQITGNIGTNSFPNDGSPTQFVKAVDWQPSGAIVYDTKTIILREGYVDGGLVVTNGTNSIFFLLLKSGGLEMNRQ